MLFTSTNQKIRNKRIPVIQFVRNSYPTKMYSFAVKDVPFSMGIKIEGMFSLLKRINEKRKIEGGVDSKNWYEPLDLKRSLTLPS
jgi:hypothetical protein